MPTCVSLFELRPGDEILFAGANVIAQCFAADPAEGHDAYRLRCLQRLGGGAANIHWVPCSVQSTFVRYRKGLKLAPLSRAIVAAMADATDPSQFVTVDAIIQMTQPARPLSEARMAYGSPLNGLAWNGILETPGGYTYPFTCRTATARLSRYGLALASTL